MSTAAQLDYEQKAYEMGKRDYARGLDLTHDNPFKLVAYGKGWIAWRRGWRDAFESNAD